jgi:hypothetical protein
MPISSQRGPNYAFKKRDRWPDPRPPSCKSSGRPLVYTRYRISLLVGAGLLGFLYFLMMRPDIAQANAFILGSLALLVVALVYAFSLRCPECHTNLMLTSRDRIQSRRRHDCTKCGVDLRAA